MSAVPLKVNIMCSHTFTHTLYYCIDNTIIIPYCSSQHQLEEDLKMIEAAAKVEVHNDNIMLALHKHTFT